MKMQYVPQKACLFLLIMCVTAMAMVISLFIHILIGMLCNVIIFAFLGVVLRPGPALRGEMLVIFAAFLLTDFSGTVSIGCYIVGYDWGGAITGLLSVATMVCGIAWLNDSVNQHYGTWRIRCNTARTD